MHPTFDIARGRVALALGHPVGQPLQLAFRRLKLRDVLRYNLKSVRAYLLKEEFQYQILKKDFM